MFRKGVIWSSITLAIMLVIILWTGMNLPAGEPIPVNFDAKGNPNRYGSKSEAMLALWVLWGTTLFVSIVLAVIPKFMPREANFKKSEKAYFACWVSMLGLMVFVTGLVAWSFLKGTSSGSTGTLPIQLIAVGMGVLYVVIGNYLPKTRSNWVIGIRTPWTLSSEYSWERTHRRTGLLFLISGVLTIALGIFGSPEIAIFVSVGSILGATLFGFIYSWWVWRKAPDRV